MGLNVAVFGASGGIGKAFIDQYVRDPNIDAIYSFSRKQQITRDPKIQNIIFDLEDEVLLKDTALELSNKKITLDIIIIATGLLHDHAVYPEKSLNDVDLETLHKIFAINCFGPTLIAKYFCPLMPRNKRCVFAALSARVGSIKDNHLSGWYAYRASKAALNMMIKNISIEIGRKNRDARIIGLHPGTTDTDLSKPFQNHIKKVKLFTPKYSVGCMLDIIKTVNREHSGRVLAYDGSIIPE